MRKKRSEFTLRLAPSLALIGAQLFSPECFAAVSDAGATTQPSPPSEVIVYSGRSRELVQPLFDLFGEQSGTSVRIRYGGTAELAATILEEGARTPADIYFAQDAGALGALARRGLLMELPAETLERVEPPYRSPDGRWVGVSGRARVVVYNTEAVDAAELPSSIMDFTDERWRGRIGWAPPNGSFQAAVTAMRVTLGEEATAAWLSGILANEPTEYPNNSSIVRAVGAGEVDVGFVNHYYLHRFLREEGEDFPARNHHTGAGDPGSLVNVAGVGLIDRPGRDEGTTRAALRLIESLLSEQSQRHFAEETFEYPLAIGASASAALVPLDEIHPPALDLSDLDALEETLDLLRREGALP
jgi:iron(III) transport system substrate-binding protein